MRTIFKTLAVAALVLAMYSCQSEPDKDDFEAREEKLSKEIEKVNVQSIYKDLMMLYCDIIEDVYNNGKETGEYDLKRLEDFENGIVADFYDKYELYNEDMFNEEDDKYGESLTDRMEAIRPMMEKIMGKDYSSDYGEPKMLEDSSFIIGTDTVKELDEDHLILNRDTITIEEYYNRLGIDVNE